MYDLVDIFDFFPADVMSSLMIMDADNQEACWKQGGMSCATVRALISMVPGSSPGLGRIICMLSLFDVLFSPLPREFFNGFSGFPPSVKMNKRVESCMYGIYHVVVVCV